MYLCKMCCDSFDFALKQSLSKEEMWKLRVISKKLVAYIVSSIRYK